MAQPTQPRAPGHHDDPDIAAALERLMLLLGRDVHALRERHGWSQKGLARAAGLHPDTVQNVEQGKGDPKLSTAVRLCYALGVELQIGLRHTPQRAT